MEADVRRRLTPELARDAFCRQRQNFGRRQSHRPRRRVHDGRQLHRRFPKTNYELRLEAMRADGHDFFAGITFPVNDSHCSWIVGGWGGSIVGLSSLDDMDASENDTSISRNFQTGRWYTLTSASCPTASWPGSTKSR